MHMHTYLMKYNKWKRNKKPHNTTQILYPICPSLSLPRFLKRVTLFYILCCFFLNLLHLFLLFTTTLLSKFLILLISFKKFLKDKNLYFLPTNLCDLSESNMWFWIRKVSLSILWKWKWQLVVLTVENVNGQWNKPELDSSYLVYECNNRIGGILSLLPFTTRSPITANVWFFLL